jgi:hypothetical protein
MPPNSRSRHRFSSARIDSDDRLYLGGRSRFLFRDLDDNREHVVGGTTTLWGIAAIEFSTLGRGGNFWWILADFQRVPIQDPTVPLEPGTRLVIPSDRTIHEQIFSESRRIG